MESIRAGFKELIVPELDRIKEENREIRAILDVTNKRLDDVNTHLADQSRRIDALREELSSEIKETNKRIDALREELSSEIRETNKRIDALRGEFGSEIKETTKRIDEAGKKLDSRLDRLYEVVVRRDEHSQVVQRLMALERDVNELKSRLAA
jgi:chromosome segregation ATPase